MGDVETEEEKTAWGGAVGGVEEEPTSLPAPPLPRAPPLPTQQGLAPAPRRALTPLGSQAEGAGPSPDTGAGPNPPWAALAQPQGSTTSAAAHPSLPSTPTGSSSGGKGAAIPSTGHFR